ncbi:MAG TPA: hypothetical protein VGI19_05595 [Candidatus Cybelea sp.]|jgi:hypothetical protein
MNRDQERNRYLTIAALTAPSAAIVWFVFHTVYEDLSASVKAIGYVDPLTQMGIFLGYVAMIGGTIVLAAIAAWSLVAALWISLRRSP